MTSRDYLAALETRTDCPSLDGSVPSTPWDPGLGEAMSRHRKVVYEEMLRTRVLDEACRG